MESTLRCWSCLPRAPAAGGFRRPASPPAGPGLVLVLGAALVRGRVPAGAARMPAALMGVASVLLGVGFFLVLVFRRFLIALFLFVVLLFMGGQGILNCVY